MFSEVSFHQSKKILINIHNIIRKSTFKKYGIFLNGFNNSFYISSLIFPLSCFIYGIISELTFK